MKKQTEDKLAPFKFHGVNFVHQSGNNQVADCPFCGSERKFYASPQTGQWDCKALNVCGLSGNVYTFLSSFHQARLKETTKDFYLRLAKFRGVPSKAFRDALIAEDGDYALLPIRNTKGTVVQLRRLDLSADKPIWFNTAGLPSQLFGAEALSDPDRAHEPVYICEGEWDALALQYLFSRLEGGICLAAPGASTWKPEWSELLIDREVNLLYDADEAGKKGGERTAQFLINKAHDLRILSWPEDQQNNDVNDFLRKRLKEKVSPQKIWRELSRWFVPYKAGSLSTGRVRSGSPPTFSELCKQFSTRAHVTKTFEDALAVVLAVCAARKTKGDPIWLFLVGPPSSGKTFIVEKLQEAPCVEFVSKLTAKSLVSGYRTGDGKDPSILANLDGKILVVKDFTAVTSMPSMSQEELYGLLRDAYDGHVHIPFGNGLSRTYSNFHFGLVAAVTDVIYGDNRGNLGERFLRYDLFSEDFDPLGNINFAMRNQHNHGIWQRELREFVADFLDQPLPDSFPSIPEWAGKQIIALAQLVAYLRAGIDRGPRDELRYRPRPEVGTRLVVQLTTLARALCFVFSGKYDRRVHEIIRKVALDTGRGWTLDIVEHLMSVYPRHIGTTELSLKANIPYSSLHRQLDALQNLDVVSVTKIENAKGRPTYGYRCKSHVVDLWKVAKLPYSVNRTKGKNGYAPTRKKPRGPGSRIQKSNR